MTRVDVGKVEWAVIVHDEASRVSSLFEFEGFGYVMHLEKEEKRNGREHDEKDVVHNGLRIRMK